MNTLKSIILALTVLNAFGCRPEAPEQATSGDAAPREMPAQFDTPPTEYSLYALDAAWTTQNGIEKQLGHFQGRPVMMAMVFTNCHYACPIIVHDMKRIAREMPHDLADDVHFVLVSLDPERDDPEALSRFARAYGLDADQWTLLHGAPGDVRMLATTLGVKYKKQSDGQYSHTNMVAVLNERGEILHREMNPGGESTSLIAALRGSAAVSAL